MVTESTGAPQRKSHYLLEISSMGVLYHDVPLCLSCHLKKKKKKKKKKNTVVLQVM